MKFEHSLKFNVVPEWQGFYLDYAALKKTIYRLQNQIVDQSDFVSDSQVKAPRTISDLIEGHSWSKLLEKGKGLYSVELEDPMENSGKLTARFLSKFKHLKRDQEIMLHDLEAGLSSNAAGSSVNKDGKNDTGLASVRSFTAEIESITLQLFVDSTEKDQDPLTQFSRQLLEQLIKIDAFYTSKEQKVFKDFENLIRDLETNNIYIDDVFKLTQAYLEDPKMHEPTAALSRKSTHRSGKDFENGVVSEYEGISDDDEENDDDDDDEDDEDDYQNSQNSALLDHSHFHVEEQKRITLKRKSTSLFIELSELKSFIELNRIGFTKICKKFDKTCGYTTKLDFVSNVLPSRSKVFVPSTIETIDLKLNKLIKIYALLVDRLGENTSANELNEIRLELKSHLRDHIVWERNTVWKDLLSMEKKSYNLELHKLASSSKMGDEGNVPNDVILHMVWKRIHLPFTVFGYNYVKIPKSFCTTQVLKLAIIVPVFIILMTVKTMNDPEEHRALAVVVTCAMLWALEALPLYITALLVPFLIVSCKILKNDDGNGHLSGPDSATYIFEEMWSSVIMLLMGGFTLAAALSKYNIAKVVSLYILAVAGTNPRIVLLAMMAVSLFLSMWISNVAAPVLCYSLAQPVLRNLPTDSPFSQALVLGIALAADIGGMASPIASPQNMVAIEAMVPSPGWGNWFAVALPVSILLMLLVWVELMLTFKIRDAHVKAYKPITDRFTIKQVYVSAVCIATIILWCVISETEGFFGSSGIISILPIILFFGPGLLTTQDLNNFPWNIIVLAMGGIALGKGISKSGLLSTVAESLQKKIMNYNVFVILLIFGALTLVIATFVSHTVAAMIIIPLVQEVGDSLPTPHSQLLVMGTALVASAAMGLPTSGFPNVTAILMTDELGKPYLTVNTFIKIGVPASIIAYIVSMTLGYGIMSSLGF